MEGFENKAIVSAEHPTREWKRYVEGTFKGLKSADKDWFHEHINNIDPHIQVIVEDKGADE